MNETLIAAADRVNYRTIGGMIETRRRGEQVGDIDPASVDAKKESGAVVTADEWDDIVAAGQQTAAGQQPWQGTVDAQTETPGSQTDLDLGTLVTMSVTEIRELAGDDHTRRGQVAALEAQRPVDQQRKGVLALAPDRDDDAGNG